MSSCVKWTGRKLTCLSKTIRASMKRRGLVQISYSWFLLCKIFKGGFKLITTQAPKQPNLCQLVPNYARCCQFWLSNKSRPVYVTPWLKSDLFWSLYGLISFSHMESIWEPDVHLQRSIETTHLHATLSPTTEPHRPIASPHPYKASHSTKPIKHSANITVSWMTFKVLYKVDR